MRPGSGGWAKNVRCGAQGLRAAEDRSDDGRREREETNLGGWRTGLGPDHRGCLMVCERGSQAYCGSQLRSLPLPSKPSPQHIIPKMPKESTKTENSQHRVCESHNIFSSEGGL